MKQRNVQQARLQELDHSATKTKNHRYRPPRTPYTALAKVYDVVNRATIGYIADVSTSGLMLFSGLTLPANQRRLVSIDLPHPERGQSTIEMGIRIVWSKAEKENLQLLVIGCEIIAIEDRAKLSLLLSSMACRANTKA